MRLCSLLAVAAIVATGTSSQVSGQPGQASAAQTPSYRTTTRAVVVDVVVSKGDDPIVGLHKQDFQIFEDGKSQIVDFSRSTRRRRRLRERSFRCRRCLQVSIQTCHLRLRATR